MIWPRVWTRTLTVLALTAAAALTLPALSAHAAPPWRPKPTGPACSGPTIYKPDGTAWTCTFDDEFTGATLDSTKWTPVTSAASGLAAGGSGSTTGCFVNSPNNISVANGVLNLTARKEATASSCTTSTGTVLTPYTSGQVATVGKFSQTYGRFAVSAKFPSTTLAGLQSALWMWPQNLAQTGLSGEIDIAEEYSQYADRAVPYLHYALDTSTVNTLTGTNIVTNTSCTISTVSAFHEYAVEWTAATITVKYDGNTCLVDNLDTLGTSPFNQPFFTVLTQALGIGTNAFDPSTTPLPATTQVDWVRAWK